ncbi:MAG: hypothetical protein JWO10_652 [Microbacteriaceae bacterium]|nr:hypothetical protein [Microbacteriaceae bacterium]
MAEAPRTRPESYDVLHSFYGHVKARPRAVFDALDARLRPGHDAESLYTADPAAFLIIAQGGWWYRAEYRVVPDEFGSNLEHVLLNVAQTGRRAGRFTGRKVIEQAPAGFERLLKELRLELE